MAKSKPNRPDKKPSGSKGSKSIAPPAITRVEPPAATVDALAIATATASRADDASRADALLLTTDVVLKSNAEFDAVLNVLVNPKEPVEVRLAALQALQSASFAKAAFEPYRNKYVTALRSLDSDPNPDLQHWVLGILARALDRPTQAKLLAGLAGDQPAVVQPEKALQLLSYDVHAGSEAAAAARKIIDAPPSEEAKVEAVRVLAADATAVPLLTKLLRSKGETAEVRQVCAAALQGMAPQKLQGYAREIVLDEDEDKDVKALSLTALTNFGDPEKLAEDAKLKAEVEKLKAEAGGKVKKSAQQFLKKYGE